MQCKQQQTTLQVCNLSMNPESRPCEGGGGWHYKPGAFYAGSVFILKDRQREPLDGAAFMDATRCGGLVAGFTMYQAGFTCRLDPGCTSRIRLDD
jgi:hypothetical protein